MSKEITRKDGPIHFHSMIERDPSVDRIVEYCVQIGEKQFINIYQARQLVASGEVTVDGERIEEPCLKLTEGTWELKIRSRTHHVVVHGIAVE